jgi:hypothetical protein
MPGLFMQDVNSKRDRGTAPTNVIKIRVGATLHLGKEARHKARALRGTWIGGADLKAVVLSSNLFAVFFTPWIADPEELLDAPLKVLR